MLSVKNYLILIAFLIISCNKTSYSEKKLSTIQYSDIENIEIRKGLYDTLCVELDTIQIKQTVNIINSPKKAELLKAGPKFWLFIKLKNDSVIKYKVLDTKIGENDLYIEMDDKDFYKKIYERGLKSRS